jgi:hypothetical protein
MFERFGRHNVDETAVSAAIAKQIEIALQEFLRSDDFLAAVRARIDERPAELLAQQAERMHEFKSGTSPGRLDEIRRELQQQLSARHPLERPAIKHAFDEKLTAEQRQALQQLQAEEEQ